MKKKLSLILAGILALGLFTGCGNSSQNDTAEGTDGKTEVTLQLKWLPSAQFTGFFVAKDKGFYEEEGLDVNILAGGSDITPATQVVNEAAQFAIANTYSILPFEEQDQPVVEVAQIFRKSTLEMASYPDSGIKTVEDLKGKRIGVWLGSSEYPVYSLLKKYNINKDTDVTIAKQDYSVDGLKNGSLDVACVHSYENYVNDNDFNLIDLGKEGFSMLEDAVITNTEFAEKNPEVVEKFLRATVKGWEYAYNNLDEAVDIVWNNVDQVSTTKDEQREFAKRVLDVVVPEGSTVDDIGTIDEANINSTAQISLEYGVIKEIPEKIYDSTYIEKAKQK